MAQRRRDRALCSIERAQARLAQLSDAISQTLHETHGASPGISISRLYRQHLMARRTVAVAHAAIERENALLKRLAGGAEDRKEPSLVVR